MKKLILFLGALSSVFAQVPNVTNFQVGGNLWATSTGANVTFTWSVTGTATVSNLCDWNASCVTVSGGTASITPANKYYELEMSNTSGWGISPCPANTFGNCYQLPVFVGAGTLSVTTAIAHTGTSTTGKVSVGQEMEILVTYAGAACGSNYIQGGTGCTGLGGHENPWMDAIGRYSCSDGTTTRIVDAVPDFNLSGNNVWAFRFWWDTTGTVTCQNGHFGSTGTTANYANLPNETFTVVSGSYQHQHLKVSSGTNGRLFTTDSIKPAPWLGYTGITALPVASFSDPTDAAGVVGSLAGFDYAINSGTQTATSAASTSFATEFLFTQGCYNGSSTLGFAPITCSAGQTAPSAQVASLAASIGVFGSTGFDSWTASWRNFAHQGIHSKVSFLANCDGMASGPIMIGSGTNCGPSQVPALTIAAFNGLAMIMNSWGPWIDIINLNSTIAGSTAAAADYFATIPIFVHQWGDILTSSNSSSGGGQNACTVTLCPNIDTPELYGVYYTTADGPSLGLITQQNTNPWNVTGSVSGPVTTEEGGNFPPTPDADHDSGAGFNERYPMFYWGLSIGWGTWFTPWLSFHGSRGGDGVATGAESNLYQGTEEQSQNSYLREFWDTVSLNTAPISTTVNGNGAVTIGNMAACSTADCIAYVTNETNRASVSGANLNFNVPAAMRGYWYDVKTGSVVGSEIVIASSGTQNVAINTLTGTAPELGLHLVASNATTVRVETSVIPSGLVNASYSVTLAAVGGTSPYTWAITDGAFPPGVALSAAGVISGTACATPSSLCQTGGTFKACVAATDSAVHTSAPQCYWLKIHPVLTFRDGSVHTFNLVENNAYGSNSGNTIETGFYGGLPPVTCSATGFSATGLSVTTGNHMCAIGGTSAATAQSDALTLTITDAASNTATQTFTVASKANPIVTSYGPSTFLATVGAAHQSFRIFRVFNSSGTETWSVVSGSLPPGLSLSSNAPNGSNIGWISGTPTTAGTYTFSVQYVDTVGTSAPFQIKYVVAAAPTIGSAAIPTQTVNRPFYFCPVMTGGSFPAYQLAYTDYLPAGVYIEPNSGCIYGTSSVTGSFPFTMTATDPQGATASQAFTLTVSSNNVPNAADTVTITNNTGATQTNVPLNSAGVMNSGQLGRYFGQGEFPSGSCPQVIQGGTPITTQVDVKNTWPDGSIKYAILGAILPSVTTGTTTLQFATQTCSNTPLTQAQMLANGFNFDSQIQLTGTSTKTFSARTMLTNGDYTLWTSGQVAQTIILGLHDGSQTCNGAPAGKYDVSVTAATNCPLSPEIIATFYPALNAVYIEDIVENVNSTQLQDQAYSIQITNGCGASCGGSSTVVYTHASATHNYLTRWIRRFWLGASAPPEVNYNFNHNLGYLVTTKTIPNFDATQSVQAAVLAADYSLWQNCQTIAGCNNGGGGGVDIYQSGSIDVSWGLGGGSSTNIGMYEAFGANYMWSGDYRVREPMLVNTDLMGEAPTHIRQGSAVILKRGDTGATGQGRILSIYGSPNTQPNNLPCTGTCTLNTVFSGHNDSHSPNFETIPYWLTGDYWYLENLMFMGGWAGWDVYTTPDGRATSPVIIQGVPQDNSVRAGAWTQREMYENYFSDPDSFPEKQFFFQMGQDTLAEEEGWHEITNGNFFINATVTVGSWTSGVATLTTGATGEYVGSQINVSGSCPAGYQGHFVVTAVTGTTVSYAVASNPGAYSSSCSVRDDAWDYGNGAGAFSGAGAGIRTQTFNQDYFCNLSGNHASPLGIWWFGDCSTFGQLAIQCEYGLNCTQGAGTITTSGTTVTFSNTAACNALYVHESFGVGFGGTYVDSSGGHIVSKACPNATVDNCASCPGATPTNWSINDDIGSAWSLFEHDYLTAEFGRAVEVGFSANGIFKYAAQVPIGLLNSTHWQAAGDGRNGTVSASTQNWVADFNTMAGMIISTFSPPLGDDEFTALPKPGVAYAAQYGYPGSAAAMTSYNTNINGSFTWGAETSPRWNILPRAAAQQSSTPNSAKSSTTVVSSGSIQ